MHAEEDKKAREAVEVKNGAEALIFQSEKALADLGDKVSESEKKPVLDAIEKLKETVKTGNTDAIKQDSEELSKAFYAISEKLYQQQAGQPGAQQDGGNQNPGANDDGVYDAEFTDK
jgi:molecular chaperone DnaK